MPGASDEYPQPSEAVAPLQVACSLAALEAVGYVGLGLTLLFAVDGERFLMGATSAVFLLVYGAAVAGFTWRLHRRDAFARSPIVMAQLLQVLVGFSAFSANAPVALVLVVVAMVTLAGIFHPDSLRALSDDPA